jgi:hypothetical protein
MTLAGLMTTMKHSTQNTLRRSSAGALAALALGAAAQPALADDHVMILIDRSGSMLTDSVADPTTASRWQVAKQLAVDAVDLVTANNRSYGLRVFNGSNTGQQIRALGSSRNSVRNAITGPDPNLGNPSGSTPLAGAICEAVDALINYLPEDLADKYLYIFSDGLENSTPSVHECFGPPSAGGSPYTLGSWEHKVVNKAQTGDPDSEAEPFLPLIVNADYLFDNEPLVFSAFAGPSIPAATIRESVVIRRQDIPRAALQSPTIRSLLLEPAIIPSSVIATPSSALLHAFAFFGGLADESGGRFRQFSSDSELPQLGDVTGDRCVNQGDVDAVRQNFGSIPAAGSLLDTNEDGIINIYDYRNVLGNYGEGKGC